MIVRLNPRAERNFSQIVSWSRKFHVIVHTRLFEIKHEVGGCEKITTITVEEWRTFALKLFKGNIFISPCNISWITKECWGTFGIIFAWNFVTWIVNLIAKIAFQAFRTLATVETTNFNLSFESFNVPLTSNSQWSIFHVCSSHKLHSPDKVCNHKQLNGIFFQFDRKDTASEFSVSTTILNSRKLTLHS